MPVIFTVFANPHGDLPSLLKEQNGIQDALDPLVASRKIEHLLRTDTNREAFFDMVGNRPRNAFSIFHYAGHASSNVVALQEGDADFREMARELVSRNPDSLELVFLNGCSTVELVQFLFELGVPAVIATSSPIPDLKATELAIRFYQHLALGEGITEAYERAVRYVNSGVLSQAQKISEKARDIFLEDSGEPGFSWGLYLRDEGYVFKGMSDLKDTQPEKPETTPPKTTVQNAEKIYNIERIENADFS